ncbi:hypothetical protein PMAYCL1PPCAC_26120 [Pristionchus mayeri]|uniref:Uncharacterized protein n=1 Tax=Pristionchus mayeri TaxID=1317129 RepID=A0AAN5D4H8_9BILA|nr:hypothetical protein PMAYCL1PPCAC_26120 [Pristionchus mayeri]
MVVLANSLGRPVILELVHDLSEILVDPILALLGEIPERTENIVAQILAVLRSNILKYKQLRCQTLPLECWVRDSRLPLRFLQRFFRRRRRRVCGLREHWEPRLKRPEEEMRRRGLEA